MFCSYQLLIMQEKDSPNSNLLNYFIADDFQSFNCDNVLFLILFPRKETKH